MECFRDPGHIALGLVAVVVLVLLALIIPAMAIFTLVGRTQKVQVCRRGVWCVGGGVDVKRENVMCGGGMDVEREGVEKEGEMVWYGVVRMEKCRCIHDH